MPQNLIDDKLALIQEMVRCRQAKSHYLRQCWLWPILPYGVARPLWVNVTHSINSLASMHIWLSVHCMKLKKFECPFPFNSLWPSDTIWWYRSGSTLAQVMAWCLTAPSHYLNQCWLIISKVHLSHYHKKIISSALWHPSEALSYENLKTPINKTRLKIVNF